MYTIQKSGRSYCPDNIEKYSKISINLDFKSGDEKISLRM